MKKYKKKKRRKRIAHQIALLSSIIVATILLKFYWLLSKDNYTLKFQFLLAIGWIITSVILVFITFWQTEKIVREFYKKKRKKVLAKPVKANRQDIFLFGEDTLEDNFIRTNNSKKTDTINSLSDIKWG